MPKKYFIFTLGCQMNISDSERIAAKLESLGYKPASEKEAGLIVVNACSVRQKAVDRIWGKIKIWQAAKKEIILTGCVLPADKKKFAEKGIKFLPTQNLFTLKNLKKSQDKPSNNLQIIGLSVKDFFDIPPIRQGDIAYIPIMTGCDNFCSYCAVPLTRGREKSRPLKDIITEAKRAIAGGSKELILLGQNVNSYGHPIKRGRCYLGNSNPFVKLLKIIDNLPGDFKFNFISSNPHDMTDEIITTFSQLKKWPRELHLPLQSGDDEILRKMNRKYSSAEYFKLIENLKFKIPASPAGGKNLSLTTDIIVGFPGETKEQFNNTVKFCKKIGFDKAYIAQYSPRPGTAAAKLKDNVSQKEKKQRWAVLEKLINKKKACPVNGALQ